MTTGSPAAPLEAKSASERKPFVLMTLLMGIIIPPLALIAGMILAWNSFFGPLDMILLFGMYLVSGFGITIGFHRYFSHKSFDASTENASACNSMVVSVACWKLAATLNHDGLVTKRES